MSKLIYNWIQFKKDFSALDTIYHPKNWLDRLIVKFIPLCRELNYRSKLRNKLLNHFGKGKLLSIGCGTMSFLKHTKTFKHTIGVDIDINVLLKAKQNGADTLYCYDINTIDWTKIAKINKVKTILLEGILEYLEYYQLHRLFKGLSEQLKQKVTIIIIFSQEKIKKSAFFPKSLKRQVLTRSKDYYIAIVKQYFKDFEFLYTSSPEDMVGFLVGRKIK